MIQGILALQDLRVFRVQLGPQAPLALRAILEIQVQLDQQEHRVHKEQQVLLEQLEIQVLQDH